MSYESILYMVENGVAVLTLNRPDRLNSFTQAMHLEVRDALDKLPAAASAPGKTWPTVRWLPAHRASTWANRWKNSTRHWCSLCAACRCR